MVGKVSGVLKLRNLNKIMRKSRLNHFLEPFENPNPNPMSICVHKTLKLRSYWIGQMGLREFQCTDCGLIFNCKCERDVVKMQAIIGKITKVGWARKWRFIPGICLECRGLDDSPPLLVNKLQYGNIFYAKHWYKISKLAHELRLRYEIDNYLNIYKQRWNKDPEWNKKIAIFLKDKYRETMKEAENIYRKKYGLIEIGELISSDKQIFDFIKAIFNEYEVIYHGAPDWLKLQYFNVWIPDLNLAFSYNCDKNIIRLAKSHKIKIIQVKKENDLNIKTFVKNTYIYDY